MKTNPKKRITRRPYGTGSVHQRKNGLWAATFEAGYTTTGKRHRITVTAKTRAGVINKLAETKTEYAKGNLKPTDKTTVKQWAEQWLKIRETTVRPKTFATDRTAINKFVIPILGHRPIKNLRPSDVRAIQENIVQNGGSTSTA